MKTKISEKVGAANWDTEKGGCYIDDSTSHSGSYSMHCKAPNSGIYQITRSLFLGIKYRIRVWIKVKNIKKARLLVCAESSNYKYGLYAYHNQIPACKEGTCVDQWYELVYDSLTTFHESSHYVICIE